MKRTCKHMKMSRTEMANICFTQFASDMAKIQIFSLLQKIQHQKLQHQPLNAILGKQGQS